jgi:hypothetical protein
MYRANTKLDMPTTAPQRFGGSPLSKGFIHRIEQRLPSPGDRRWRKVIFLVVTLRFGPCAKSLFIPDAPIQQLNTSTSLSSPFLLLNLCEFCLLQLPFHRYRTCCTRLHQTVIRG